MCPTRRSPKADSADHPPCFTLYPVVFPSGGIAALAGSGAPGHPASPPLTPSLTPRARGGILPPDAELRCRLRSWCSWPWSERWGAYLDTTTNSPPHPDPLPLGGGEGEAHVLPTILPRPRRGGEGRGEGAGGGTDKKRPAMGWGEELACQAGAQMAEIVG
jgi:hypothetical protein